MGQGRRLGLGGCSFRTWVVLGVVNSGDNGGFGDGGVFSFFFGYELRRFCREKWPLTTFGTRLHVLVERYMVVMEGTGGTHQGRNILILGLCRQRKRDLSSGHRNGPSSLTTGRVCASLHVLLQRWCVREDGGCGKSWYLNQRSATPRDGERCPWCFEPWHVHEVQSPSFCREENYDRGLGMAPMTTWSWHTRVSVAPGWYRIGPDADVV
jgi:hypothetical protein